VAFLKKHWVMVKKIRCLFISCSFAFPFFAQSQSQLTLWYDRPARIWEETLPLGNGRLGMTPDGGIERENIVLNDITLWSGSPQDANNYEANKQLPAIRRLLQEGKNDEAQDLINAAFVCKGPGSGGAQWGCFQVLGNLALDYTYAGGWDSARIKNYRRFLSLDDAAAVCSFELNGVTYKREYITSFGTDVAFIRLTASKPSQLNCSLAMSRPERGTSLVTGNTLYLSGQLDNGTDGKGMQYQAAVRVKTEGGTVVTSGASLVIKNATSVLVCISAATDYKNPGYKNTISQLLSTGLSKNFDQEKKVHAANYKKLFQRVYVDLGTGSNSQLPTNERLSLFYQNPDKDRALPVLFFQFGRYLSISSTRIGLLPPNLQGLWANQVRTPWNGDYHLDVNVEMNHWPLEAVNLSELNLPLADLVKGLVPNGKKTAKAYYNASGWIAHVITNIWGYTEPGESASWGMANSGSGWLCNNLWDHYAFTGDKKYLKDIYPVLKGSAKFYNDVLVKYPGTNWLVTAPSVSPENSFYLPNGKTANVCMGPTIDNSIVQELFSNVIEASATLGTDADFRKELQAKLAQLPPVRVSKDGRIMEWMEEYKETDKEHRHISHLWALYPGTRITPTLTPDLIAPAKKTLEVRGDDGPSWTIAYKLLFWARLQDGNRAFKLLKEILKPTLRTDINYGAGGGVYPNLLSAGPPFQIDGNFGATAGIVEMLLQSHDGFIEFIPAIPELWKSSGEVKGLKARGNFTVDMKWKDGRISNYRITSPVAKKVKIKINGAVKEVTATPAGATYTL